MSLIFFLLLFLLTSNNSTAVARFSGFLTRHLETKSMNSADHLSGCLKEGGGFVGIMKMACNPTCHEIFIFDNFTDNQVKHTYHWTINMNSYMGGGGQGAGGGGALFLFMSCYKQVCIWIKRKKEEKKVTHVKPS